MSTSDPTDLRWFRQVLGQYPTGVCVVTATHPDGGRDGFVVGSFTSVSLDPPLVAFFPAKSSTSWPRIRDAGKFCVNILSAEQEHICRRFAARGADKFSGIAFREADSGSPIITGAVAWIDCDLESVTEAGDHYVVIGRVRRLDVENACLPLLFFQGGYGRFAPLSLAAGDTRGVLTEQLRQVDLVRQEMERVAADVPGARILAVTLAGDELVVTASAGGSGSASPATVVGQRLAFVPPMGIVFAAWMEGAQLERWLTHLPSAEARTDERERLAVVRRRGFSAVVLTEAQRELESTLARLAADPAAVDAADLHGRVRQLEHEPIELSPEIKASVGAVNVPVFGRDGRVAVLLSLYGFRRPTTPHQADALIERLRSAGRNATKLLGGDVGAE